jgi:hypothetical protein
MGERLTRIAIVAAGALFFAAGAGWAITGDEVFLATVMAGLAYCF